MTNTLLNELKKLQSICEKQENIQLKLNWDTLHTKSEKELNNCSYFEDGMLVGFIGIYGFGNKVEICGLVHPEYRRRGVFTKLYSHAIKEAKDQKFRQVLMNAPGNSESGKAWLKNLPFEHAFTEYQMKCSKVQLDDENGVVIRQRTAADAELEIELDARCFGFNREEAADFNSEIMKEKNQDSYIIEYDGVSVGKIRVSCRNNKDTWIYGFAVLPEYQGRGIGRKTLKKVVADERKLGHDVFLEVEARNNNAFKLYTSCGFQSFYTQDYYNYTGE